MKKLALGVALFTALAYQSQAQINVAATIGPQFPTGDFGNLCNVGFGFTATGRYMINPNFAVGLNIGYYSFSVKDADNASVGLTPVTALLEYHFSTKGKLQPYVGGDLGFYNLSFTAGNGLTAATSSKTYFGIAPTFGINYALANNFSLTGNLKINDVLADQSLVSVGLNLGAAYSFKQTSKKSHSINHKK